MPDVIKFIIIGSVFVGAVVTIVLSFGFVPLVKNLAGIGEDEEDTQRDIGDTLLQSQQTDMTSMRTPVD